MHAIGDELRGRRQHLKLGRDELAERTGLGVSSIRRYEDGLRAIPLDRFHALAAALDTTVPAIVAEAARKHPQAFVFNRLETTTGEDLSPGT